MEMYVLSAAVYRLVPRDSVRVFMCVFAPGFGTGCFDFKLLRRGVIIFCSLRVLARVIFAAVFLPGGHVSKAEHDQFSLFLWECFNSVSAYYRKSVV